MNKFTKRTLAIGASAALLTSAGVAFAYWTADGEGTGTAATGTTSPITVVQTSVLTDLYPGISQNLSGTFTNPNTFPVHVGQVSVAVDPEWADGDCDAADFTLTQPDPTNAQVLVDDTSTWSGATITLINKALENQDDCKDAVVDLVYSTTTS